MAIALIDNNPRGRTDFVPVCAVFSFNKYWIPGAEALGLKWVMEFGWLEFNSENQRADQVPELLSELRRLRAWFERHADPEERVALVSNVDNLLVALEDIAKAGDVDITIG